MKYDWPRYGLKELAFVRSWKDLRILLAKASYLFPRAMGISRRYARVPYSLQIEPTNHCNANCLCCSRVASSRERGYMDFALFMRIIDEASLVGVRVIRLYGQGEPLLHPRIVDMVAYVKSRALRLHLVTNGTLLDAGRGEAILRSQLDSGDRVIISVLGYSKEVHEMVMKGVDHDQVVGNIHGLVALRRHLGTNGPVIETVFLSLPENASESREFSAYWRSVVDHVRVSDISTQFAEFKSETRMPRPVRTRTCAYLWDRMLIFWNGDATVCIADLDGTYCLGNLRDRSIRDIWNCKALMSVKRMHRRKRFAELPLCSTCDW